MLRFSTTFLALAFTAPLTVQATSPETSTSFAAGSHAGRHLLQQATRVSPSSLRRAQQDYEWEQQEVVLDEYNYLDNLSTMTIRYVGCSSFMETDTQDYDANEDDEDEEQAANNGQDQYWKYQYMARQDGLMPNNLVRFTLCEGSTSANSCNTNCQGEYVIDMEVFLEAYTEYQMEHDAYWCEVVRENCVCNNGNSWKDCYSSCFAQKGYSYEQCAQVMNANNNGGDNAFEAQQYLTCSGVEFYNPQYMYNNRDNGDDEDNYKKYWYLGLTCQNHQNVMLTGFYDEQCSYQLENSDLTLMQDALGSSYQHVPYLDGTPLLTAGTCLSCMSVEDEVDYQKAQKYNNGQQQQEQQDDNKEQPDAIDLCQMITTNAENGGYATICDMFVQDGCSYIHQYLPRMDGRSVWTQLQTSLARSRTTTRVLGIVILVGLVGAAGWCWWNQQEERRQRLGNPDQKRALLSISGSGSSDDEKDGVMVQKPAPALAVPPPPVTAPVDAPADVTTDSSDEDLAVVTSLSASPTPVATTASDEDVVVITSPSQQQGEMA